MREVSRLGLLTRVGKVKYPPNVRNERDVWSVKVMDDLDDQGLQDVADFFNLYFPGVFYPRCTPEIFRWKLGSGNPAGPGFLTVAMSEGKVVGTTSGTRRTVLSADSSVDAMEIGDTFTHPDFRRRGNCDALYPGTVDFDEYLNKSVFGRLVTETLDRARTAGIKQVFGTPNENSRPPYINRLDFREVGWGKIRSWSYPTRNFTLNSKTKFVLPVLTLSLRLTQKIKLLVTTRDLKVTETTFGSMLSRFDALSQNKRRGTLKSGSVSMNQSRAYLEHRYAMHPNYQYRYYEIAEQDGPVGWIICVSLTRQSRRETLVISDWILIDETHREHLPKYAAMIASNHTEVQLVSLWAEDRFNSRVEWGSYGFYSPSQVSLIAKNLDSANNDEIQEFTDFRIGWSDNG